LFSIFVNFQGYAILQLCMEPHLTDLGYTTREMSESLLVWSHQLTRLGNQLVRDQNLDDRNSMEYQRHRRNIQNNMDAAKYLSSELQNFCTFMVPLNESRPRRLGVITPQTHRIRSTPNEFQR